MKRKGLFITVLSTMLLGVGVFAGVSSVSENAPVEKAEAWSGSTTDSSLYIFISPDQVTGEIMASESILGMKMDQEPNGKARG